MLLFLYVLSQCVIKQADKCNKLSQLTDNFMSGHIKVTIQCYCFVSDSHVCNSHVIGEGGFHILYMHMVLSVLYILSYQAKRFIKRSSLNFVI